MQFLPKNLKKKVIFFCGNCAFCDETSVVELTAQFPAGSRSHRNSAFRSLSAHAAPLSAVFSSYGYKAATANLATESTLIDSFRKDLSAEGMRGHIEALPGMEETLAALWEAEDAFKAQNLRNTQTAVATAGQKSATELRKEILALINDKIVPYLSIMQQVSAAALGTFAQEMEKEISRANASVAARKKSSK